MDILSASLATMISAMTGTISDTYITNANAKLTSQVVHHRGHDIYFEHQIWRIRGNTVCKDKQHKITEYSQCTLAAKAVFNAVCKAHQHKNYSDHKARNMVRMYCEAARTFKPTIASIQASNSASIGNTNHRAALAQANQKCAALILESQTSKDPFIQSKKKKACQRYKELSGQ